MNELRGEEKEGGLSLCKNIPFFPLPPLNREKNSYLRR